jgi:hypothetical protein
LLSATQGAFSGRDLAHRGLFIRACVDCSHACGHKTTAAQTSPFAANDIIGMKVSERYGAEKIAAQWCRASDQFGELIECMTPDLQVGTPA